MNRRPSGGARSGRKRRPTRRPSRSRSERTLVPPTVAPFAGAVSDPAGAVLSMRTLARIGLVPEWPGGVGRDDAEVVETVGQGSRVERRTPRGRRVAGDRHPGAAARCAPFKVDWARIRRRTRPTARSVPLRYWPGSASVGVGSTLSTETFRTGDVVGVAGHVLDDDLDRRASVGARGRVPVEARRARSCRCRRASRARRT